MNHAGASINAGIFAKLFLIAVGIEYLHKYRDT